MCWGTWEKRPVLEDVCHCWFWLTTIFALLNKAPSLLLLSYPSSMVCHFGMRENLGHLLLHQEAGGAPKVLPLQALPSHHLRTNCQATQEPDLSQTHTSITLTLTQMQWGGKWWNLLTSKSYGWGNQFLLSQCLGFPIAYPGFCFISI